MLQAGSEKGNREVRFRVEEQQRRRGSRVLLGHYATSSSKAFLVLSSLPGVQSVLPRSKVYSRGAQLPDRSRPFNEHFVAAYIKLCLL